MMPPDKSYVGLPWKDKGETRSGVDCVGLACLFLREQFGLDIRRPATDPKTDVSKLLQGGFNAAELKRGDVVFFRVRQNGNKIAHVATYLGNNQYLHIVNGGTSRIETGLKLARRIGLTPVGSIPPSESVKLAEALANHEISAVLGIIGMLIVIALSVVSSFMMPGLSGLSNRKGVYGENPLATSQNPEIPLPDILGTVTVAGNSVYQQLPDKANATGNPQKWNQVIVLASGPVSLVDYVTGLQVNGISWQDKSFYEGTNLTGLAINPSQTKEESVTGSIGGDSNVPSMTIYQGEYDISVPVDVRAQYDRDFPIYGFSGCSYIVFRKIDSTKFQSFNITTRVNGRLCRTFDEDGFVRATVSGESLTGADGSKVRFKLAHDDIESVASVTVNGTSYSQISASSQTGNVYHLNSTKGYIEFITAPSNGATVLITYTYFVREFSKNPAVQAVYLLTDRMRGKGFLEDKIDWASVVAARDYYDETVTWTNSLGKFDVPRWETNYCLDSRKPIQDHLQAIQDGSRMLIFLSSGKIYIRPKANDSSVFTFDESNLILEDGNSALQEELSDRSNKPNRIRIFYRSQNTLNAETEAAADDEANQSERSSRVGNNGVVETNLTIPAITAQPHAERMATNLLTEALQSNRVYQFKSNIVGLALQPLDVVTLDHPSVGTPKLLRIEGLNLIENDILEVTASEYCSTI